MPENNIKCPKCHGTKFTQLADGQYKCVYCGTVFTPAVPTQEQSTNEAPANADQPQIIINVNGQSTNGAYSDGKINTKSNDTSKDDEEPDNNSNKKVIAIIAGAIVLLALIIIISVNVSHRNDSMAMPDPSADTATIEPVTGEPLENFEQPTTETAEPSIENSYEAPQGDNSSLYDESQDESNDASDVDDEYQESEDAANAGY